LVLVLIAALGGGYGSRRGWGYYGWSPLAIIVVILIVLYLTGYLNV
jgi:hypothetical protein